MIQITELGFSYGKTPFIEHLNLQINPGEIVGFLGPSGAGKTTLQKILIGLLPGYSGSAKVNGMEVRERTNTFYESIGVMFEYPTLYEQYTARQNLVFFSSLYDTATPDIDELLDQVGLLVHADKKVAAFSKGMRSRLCFIKAIMHHPKVLFLDEPTSGLDPTNAHIIKELICAQRAVGTTVVLTTHQMHDAAELCDRVAFIVDGKIKATDCPKAFIRQAGAATVTYTYIANGKEHTGSSLLASISTDSNLQAAIAANALISIHSSEPDLGKIFMAVTGRKLT